MTVTVEPSVGPTKAGVALKLPLPANCDGTPACGWESGPSLYSPVWSPDGKQLVFVRQPLGGFEDEAGLYLMDADGGNPRQLLPYEVPLTNGRIAWRPK